MGEGLEGGEEGGCKTSNRLRHIGLHHIHVPNYLNMLAFNIK